MLFLAMRVRNAFYILIYTHMCTCTHVGSHIMLIHIIEIKLSLSSASPSLCVMHMDIFCSVIFSSVIFYSTPVSKGLVRTQLLDLTIC